MWAYVPYVLMVLGALALVASIRPSLPRAVTSTEGESLKGGDCPLCPGEVELIDVNEVSALYGCRRCTRSFLLTILPKRHERS